MQCKFCKDKSDANSKRFKKENKIKYQKIQELWPSFDPGPSWHLS